MRPIASIAATQRRRNTPPAGQSGAVVVLTLTSTAGGSNLPFCFGQAFKQGDVMNASTLGGDIPLQVTTKNSWPDGSLKYALIAGRKTLAANTPATVTLSNGGLVDTGADLAIADLKATGVTASIAYGAYGTASWSGTDWDTPFQTIALGAEVSAWTFRKPIGSDTHLVAWLEVRLFAGGQVCVMPWIENGYLNVASPNSRTGTATFTLGGSQRYSAALTLLNHQRAVLASGTTFAHWLGSDPAITPKHDATYFLSTKLVPNYRGSTGSGSALYSRLATSYTPLAQGQYRTEMGDPGYDPSIGLLPEWDVAYITGAGDVRAYRAVMIQALQAGRYGVHYRDETTNRPLLFASYPNTVIGSGNHGIAAVGASSNNTYTPTASGTAPPTYDSPHHPSMGYMAYLLSGWNYFAEEVQLLATLNYLKVSNSGSGGRGGSSGYFESSAGSNIPRGAAWCLRTLAQAACVTPDADTTLRASFGASVDANIDYYHGKYIAQANNPLGLVHPYDQYGTPGGIWESSSWMDDFMSAAWGYLSDLKVHSTGQATKLQQFLSYKFGAIVGRLGGNSSSEFSYRYAAQYTVYFAPSDSANYGNGSGPWYSDWGACARAMGITVDGTTGQSIVEGTPGAATSYLANLMPAISYAVDHGAAGAAAAWARLAAASNFNSHVALYNDDPVWGVKPRTV